MHRRRLPAGHVRVLAFDARAGCDRAERPWLRAGTARFRFRGASTAEVELQIRAELAELRVTTRPQPSAEIVLLGTGARPYREYGLPAVA